jgi:two-component system cell cycle sensor histidine kinase/response regulator CckA
MSRPGFLKSGKRDKNSLFFLGGALFVFLNHTALAAQSPPIAQNGGHASHFAWVLVVFLGGGLIAVSVFACRFYLSASLEKARASRFEVEAKSLQAEAEKIQIEAKDAQKKVEQALDFTADLIESATVAIIGVDQRGEIHLYNKTAKGLTGYSVEELTGGDWVSSLFPGNTYTEARKSLLKMIRGDSEASIETLLISRSGGEKMISWQCRKMLYRDEPLVLLFGVDMTERAMAERERHDLERKLLDVQKLKSLGMLAGGIAHDFNNLLTAILGNAQLAKLRIGRSSPVQQHLIDIERTSLQAADLCKQMLAYSGQGKVEVRSLNVNQIVRDMSQLLRISVDKRVNLSFNLAAKLPAIRGDVSQIRQVLMNLVINASEAITDSEGSIWVSTGVVHGAKYLFKGIHVTGQPEERDYVFLEVADTGCGIDEETQAKMFDPFFTTKFTGRGLGLAAVLGIVRSHGGTLELDTRKGEGTTFTLLFPSLGGGSVDDEEEDSGPVSHWVGEGLALVVDDEENVRGLATKMLETFGFLVITANDGREAVEKFSVHVDAITVVLMDVTMPVMGGTDALEKIRQISPDTPVLLMSGFMQDGELGKLTGATDYLQKPFPLEDLQKKLRVLLDSPVEEV